MSCWVYIMPTQRTPSASCQPWRIAFCTSGSHADSSRISTVAVWWPWPRQHSCHKPCVSYFFLCFWIYIFCYLKTLLLIWLPIESLIWLPIELLIGLLSLVKMAQAWVSHLLSFQAAKVSSFAVTRLVWNFRRCYSTMQFIRCVRLLLKIECRLLTNGICTRPSILVDVYRV